MKVTLFIPCFVDLMYPAGRHQHGADPGDSSGHTVECPEELACCGQPAFNSGYWDESRGRWR